MRDHAREGSLFNFMKGLNMRTMALTIVITALASSSPAHLLWVVLNMLVNIAKFFIH